MSELAIKKKRLSVKIQEILSFAKQSKETRKDGFLPQHLSPPHRDSLACFVVFLLGL